MKSKYLNIENLSKFFLIFAGLWYVFHFLFFWVLESTDSYFYWAFSNFIKTGIYYAPYYNYTVPSTMEPPLYSGFLFLFQFFPRADVIIHLAQLGGVGWAGYCLHRITSWYFGKNIGRVVWALFMLVPAHLIYTSNLVAESIAIFFIGTYLLLLHQYLNEKKENRLPMLLVWAAVGSLQRYNFLSLWGVGVLLVVGKIWAISTKKSLPRFFSVKGFLVGFVVSFCIIVGWVFVNHSLNGAWSFSNAEGKHLWNRILHFDRLMPPKDDPAYMRFVELAGEQEDYFKPWWFYEPLLMAKLGSETKSSEVMADFALAALKTDPLRYVVNTPGFFLFAHNTNPTYSDRLYRYNGTMKQGCRVLGSISFCTPIIDLGFNYGLWDYLVEWVDWWYLNVSRWINFLILFPAIIYAVVQKNLYIRILGVLYVLSILFFSMTEAPLPRYTYNFTPLKATLIAFFVFGFVFPFINRLLHSKKL